MHVRHLFPVVVLFLLAGCGASIDPVLVAKIDAFYANAKSAKIGPAGPFSAPMAYAEGQWVMHGITSDGKRSVVKTSLIGREQGGWVLESSSVSPSAESVTQMCVAGLEEAAKAQDLDKIDILWVKLRDENGQVQSVEGPALSIMKGFYRKGLAAVVIKSSALQPEAGEVTVPAGSFAACTKAKSEISIAGSTTVSETWCHPAVPINGMVKSVSDDGTTMELLAYGKTGALKSF